MTEEEIQALMPAIEQLLRAWPKCVCAPAEPEPEPEPEPVPVWPPVPGPATGNQWILDNFASERIVTGNPLTWQQAAVADPALVKDATRVGGTNYGIKVFNTNTADPERGKRIAFVNVDVRDQVASGQYGASIATSGGTDWYTGLDVFMSNVTVEPNWPNWAGYSSTNQDGMTLDGGWMHGHVYLEDVSIKSWAESAIDVKPGQLQAVRLKTAVGGQSTLKFWQVGPHYIVDSDISNDGSKGGNAALIECAGGEGKHIVINVYNSRFNGSPTVPEDKVWHSGGSTVEFVYLTVDPRTTGEMHPMFLAP